MKTITKTLGASLLLLATSVSANVITFDYTNTTSSNYTVDSLSVTEGGVTVDITAWEIDNNGGGVISALSQIFGDSDNGVYFYESDRLGVESGSSDSNLIDGASSSAANDGDHSSDSSDIDEGLLFTFSESVSLSFIDFDSWDSNDDFNLTVDGVSLMVDFGTNDSNIYGYNDNNNSSYFNFNNIVGTEFLFWADGDSDNFRIDYMRVSKVPEPSIIALLGLGMMGIAFSRRKMKK